MKRFFTKKSVAVLSTIAILVIFLLPFSFSVKSNNNFGFTRNSTYAVDEQGYLDYQNSPLQQQVEKEKAASPQQNIGFVASYVVDGVNALLNEVILRIVNLWLGAAGSMLDFAVDYTIFGHAFDDVQNSINSIWVIFRDTANIIFIFVLLYAGIKQIVLQEASKKILTSVIISAVLINFSMFITKIGIDVSNMVGSSIFNQIAVVRDIGNTNDFVNSQKTNGNLSVSTNIIDALHYSSISDLSGRIMDAVQLQDSIDYFKNDNVSTSLQITLSVVLQILLSLVLFIFFASLFILILGRFLTLVILVATSPIGFVGDILPILSEPAKEWRKSLTDQLLMIPALFFFLLLLFKFASQIRTSLGSGNSLVILIFNFIIINFLLFKILKMVKGMSGSIGAIADKFAGMAVGLASGATAMVARQTVGRAASSVLRKEDSSGRSYEQRLLAQSEMGGIQGNLAKAQLAALGKTAKSTFDFRGDIKSTVGKVAEYTPGASVKLDVGKESGKFGKDGKNTGFYGAVEARNQEVKADATKLRKMEAEANEKDQKNIKNYDEQIALVKARIDMEQNPETRRALTNDLNKLEEDKERNTSVGIKKMREQQEKNTVVMGVNGAEIKNAIDIKENQLKDTTRHVDFQGDVAIKQFESDKKKMRDDFEKNKDRMSEKDIEITQKDIEEKTKEINRKEIERMRELIENKIPEEDKRRRDKLINDLEANRDKMTDFDISTVEQQIKDIDEKGKIIRDLKKNIDKMSEKDISIIIEQIKNFDPNKKALLQEEINNLNKLYTEIEKEAKNIVEMNLQVSKTASTAHKNLARELQAVRNNAKLQRNGIINSIKSWTAGHGEETRKQRAKNVEGAKYDKKEEDAKKNLKNIFKEIEKEEKNESKGGGSQSAPKGDGKGDSKSETHAQNKATSTK